MRRAFLWALLLSSAVALDGSVARAATFSWRLVEQDRQLVAEVLAGEVVVMRIREALGGLTVAERAATVVNRLEGALDRPVKALSLRPDRTPTGDVVVRAGSQLIVTVHPASARFNDSTAEGLAWVWANRLRRAIGAAPLVENPLAEEALAGGLPVGGPSQEVYRDEGDGLPAERYEVVVASWYGREFQGRPTASGEPFHPWRFTAAHRSLPFGTRVRVTNPENGRSVVVRINDRGPFVAGRDIDLSRAAAEVIGLVRKGVGPVQLEVVGPR